MKKSYEVFKALIPKQFDTEAAMAIQLLFGTICHILDQEMIRVEWNNKQEMIRMEKKRLWDKVILSGLLILLWGINFLRDLGVFS